MLISRSLIDPVEVIFWDSGFNVTAQNDSEKTRDVDHVTPIVFCSGAIVSVLFEIVFTQLGLKLLRDRLPTSIAQFMRTP